MDIPPVIMNPIMLLIMPAIPDDEGDNVGKDAKRFNHMPKRNCAISTTTVIQVMTFN